MSSLSFVSSLTGQKVCVVGGGGNLGSCIIEELCERGAVVSSFDLVPFKGDGDVESHVGSITGDGEELVAAFRGCAVVIHTASVIDIRPVPSPLMHDVNVHGTFNVIRACKKAGVGSLIYTSSIEVVSGKDARGKLLKVEGVDECAPIPATHHLPYAHTKAIAEQLVVVADSAELRTVSIRPGYIMGAGCIGLRLEAIRAKQRQDHYVSSLIPATISTVHRRNCALAHVLAAEKAQTPGVHGECFFIRDFEDNVVRLAVQCFKSSGIVKAVLIPLWLAFAIAWVLDRFERAMHFAYNLVGKTRMTADDLISVEALSMAWFDIIVSDAKARQRLGYESVVSKADCISESAEWVKTFYAGLSAAPS